MDKSAGKHGGKRAGAGRKPKTVTSQALDTDDPAEFLTALMRDSEAPIKDRKDAAKALLRAQITGKKGKKAAAAGKVAEGERFAPTAPPKLALVK